jgi:hypothetical protein
MLSKLIPSFALASLAFLSLTSAAPTSDGAVILEAHAAPETRAAGYRSATYFANW